MKHTACTAYWSTGKRIMAKLAQDDEKKDSSYTNIHLQKTSSDHRKPVSGTWQSGHCSPTGTKSSDHWNWRFRSVMCSLQICSNTMINWRRTWKEAPVGVGIWFGVFLLSLVLCFLFYFGSLCLVYSALLPLCFISQAVCTCILFHLSLYIVLYPMPGSHC